MDPLEILPEEMWIRVLENLTTQEDFLPAYYTCLLWNSLLGKKQTEWMFQGVFPSLMKYLPKTDILTCRRVSKQWNEIIDSFLESKQLSINAAGNPYQQVLPYRQRCLLVHINESADRRCKSVMETLKYFHTLFNGNIVSTSVKNPFVSRSLELSITELNSTVLEFFETFGAHLWFLQLTISMTERVEIVPPLPVFQFIWNILQHVPNLKKLVIDTHQSMHFFHEAFPTKEERHAQKLEVEQFVKNNPVPSLPYLKNLQLTGNCAMLQQVLDSAYTPQLTKYVYSRTEKILPKNLTQLTELVCTWSPRSRKLHQLNCPSLQRLCIIVDIVRTVEPPTQQIFKGMETFQYSLKYLYIYWAWWSPNFPSQLNLPFVEEFCLEVDYCQDIPKINFSCLKTLTSLRKLKCVFEKADFCQLKMLRAKKGRKMANDKVDLKYHFDFDRNGGLYNSNVWRLVPTLDTVVVYVWNWKSRAQAKMESRVYTRSEMTLRTTLLSRAL